VSAQRILAVIAAVLFVGAVALATTGPEMISLGAALACLSQTAELDLHNWLVRVLGSWAWDYVGQPLLIRPAWLPFGSLGLLFSGLALSWPSRDGARRSHHRRS
jgi:hypothetical protein